MDQPIVINIIVGLVSAFIASGLAVEIFRRRTTTKDEKKREKKELSAAELAFEQAFIDKLLIQIDKLTMAERALIDERIAVNREIDRLQAEVNAVTSQNGNQDEEIIEKTQRIVELNATVERLQIALADLRSNKIPGV